MTASEPFRAVRESLLQLGALAADLPRHTPTVCQVAAARDKVADLLALPEVLTPEQENAIYDRFRWWLDGRGEQPSDEEWAFSPFVYFRGDPQLAQDPRFASGVAVRLERERLPRMLKRAIYAYLRDYSPAGASVDALGRLIRESLPRHHSAWAEDWRSRAAPPLALFDPEGLANRLAGAITVRAVAPRVLMRELGFSAELTVRSGLHRPIAEALLEQVRSAFAAAREVDPEVVRLALEFLREGEVLRFPELRGLVADSLLGPFAEAIDPSDEVRGALTAFFDQLYGSPRDLPGNWADASELARRVMLRWLVRKSLDLFFDVLSKTADPIWRYRRAFWLALYRHGLIEDAWPAFGRTAQRHVSRNQALRARLPSYGELRGAQAEQSVMVMKMRGFTVAEWSHAGACRIWPPGDVRAPSIGRADYYATDLREDCLHSQRHTNSMSGGWQGELSAWIAQRTGVRVPLGQLMANTHA